MQRSGRAHEGRNLERSQISNVGSQSIHGKEKLWRLKDVLLPFARNRLESGILLEPLADFLAKTPLANDKYMKIKKMESANKALKSKSTWKLYTDGASSFDGSAEYEALLAGLRIVADMKIKEMSIFIDFQLVANQKKKVDALSKLASMTFSRLAKEVLVEVLVEKSIIQKEVADIIKEEGEIWMLPVREYLLFGLLPKDPQKARKLRVKAPQDRIINGNLYHNSYLSPWLRCVGPIQAKSIIQEIHQGSRGMHARPR
ncbi:reverse transcriptase domain-containing protein [Tanacetum coccineum]